MKKNFKSILAVTLAASLAVSGLSYFSVKKANADEAAPAVEPLKTLDFDSEEDIIAANDSAAAIISDDERGGVISLGAGDASVAMVGAQITNPWADPAVNPDGAKAYTKADINAAYDYALGLEYGDTFRDGQEVTVYPVRKEGEGGVSWRNLVKSTATQNSNGDVTDDDNTGVNTSLGDYRGAEAAKAAMGDFNAATEAKEKKVAIKRPDGTNARVSSYKVENENNYFRPVWGKEDGLTMSVWVKVPEGTPAGTILFSFFNDRVVGALDSEKTKNFNDFNGHLFVTADGSIEFRELSYYAGDPDSSGGGTQISGYAASRNHYEASSVGSAEGLTPAKKAGEWVYVTLVCENDYISVYFDGEQVDYIEQGISNMDYKTGKIKAEITDDGQFLQDWDHPELSGKWTTDAVSTQYKEFNARFASRNTPVYQLVNDGIYSHFPTWNGLTNRTKTPTANFLTHAGRITLCQWLQDEGTTLYLGGSAGRDLNTFGPGANGENTHQYVNQYTVLEGTAFDNFAFYGEALTKDEVASAYAAELEKPVTTPKPAEPTTPGSTETATPEPEESDTPIPTETATPEPTETATPEPEESDTPEPTETVKPEGVLGSLTDDDVIDAEDALAVLKHAAKIQTIAKELQWAADVNFDGVIDAEDALQILKYAAKIITEFTAK